jgi:hypothetical protein
MLSTTGDVGGDRSRSVPMAACAPERLSPPTASTRVDLADQVDRELVACRRDRPEAQLLTRRVGAAHPGGQPPGERPPGLGARDLRAHGEELPQRFRVGAARHADDPGEPSDDTVARSHYGP